MDKRRSESLSEVEEIVEEAISLLSQVIDEEEVSFLSIPDKIQFSLQKKHRFKMIKGLYDLKHDLSKTKERIKKFKY